MNCQRCNSIRVLNVSANRNGDAEGYVPHYLGIGDGDYVEFSYCADCGQIQGAFPLPPFENEEEYHLGTGDLW